VAGGGPMFFLCARTLFDRVPGFSEHPRYDAGEVVGPLVAIVNATVIGVSVFVFLCVVSRRGEPGISPRVNRAAALVGAAVLLLALADRLFLYPEIVGIRARLGRAGFDEGASSPDRQRFGMLHGIENAVQLACVLLAWAGLALETALRRTRADANETRAINPG
jgi:uncharacterized protein DUF4149